MGFFDPKRYEVKDKPARFPLCGRCGLSTQCRHPKMQPTGEGKIPVLLVAEAPGSEEDKIGRQLVGESGQLLRSVLHEIGYSLEDCWKTNAVICRPPNNKMESKFRICCRPHLVRTIQKLQPQVIIVLGETALESILEGEWKKGVEGISRWVGWHIPMQKYNAWVCPTFHPSYLLRNSKDVVLAKLFKQHLRRAFSLSKKKKPFPDVSWMGDAELIFNASDAEKRIKDLCKKEGVVAFDYETTGLKPDSKGHRIVSVSFCFEGKETFACLFHHSLHDVMKQFLLRKELKKVASNLKFETRWSKTILGVSPRGWDWDTMLAAHVLDNRSGITSIKFQGFVRYGIADYDSHVESFLRANTSNEKNKIEHLPIKDLLLYNAQDSALEYRVMLDQKKEMNF